MPTLTGRNTRTLTGYAATLLDYPRWLIERDVDFTDCHLSGKFAQGDQQCADCQFGQACCWLNSNRAMPSPNTPLEDLLSALTTAVEFLRSSVRGDNAHPNYCECDTCLWLHDASSFLRTHRRRT